MEVLRRAEDTHVDRLFAAAPDHGAVLIAATFPRSYIDPNRAEDDVDPAMMIDAGKGWPVPLNPGEKSRLGLGLIRAIINHDRPIYDRKLGLDELRGRLERYYRPYHERLSLELDRLHRAFGEVWHVDCHSMGRIGRRNAPFPGERRADVVLGNRDGETADPEIMQVAALTLRRAGLEVALNHPYKGAEIVRRYGNPGAGRHSFQIEVVRELYMDEMTLEPHDGMTGLIEALDRMIQALADALRSRIVT